jgi:hypothetical protein
MTQKPPALFVPNVYALGHLGHVVYVDPNDPSAPGWYPVGTRLVPGWYPVGTRLVPGWYLMTQMTQTHQAASLSPSASMTPPTHPPTY